MYICTGANSEQNNNQKTLEIEYSTLLCVWEGWVRNSQQICSKFEQTGLKARRAETIVIRTGVCIPFFLFRKTHSTTPTIPPRPQFRFSPPSSLLKMKLAEHQRKKQTGKPPTERKITNKIIEYKNVYIY